MLRVLARRVRLPQFLKDDYEKIDQLVQSHEDAEGRVRYRDFIAEMKGLGKDSGLRKGRIGVGETQRSASSVGSASEIGIERRSVFDSAFTVLDPRKVSYNMLESIQASKRIFANSSKGQIKCNRVLKRRFPT